MSLMLVCMAVGLAYSQTPCPVTAIVNPDGTITISGPGINQIDVCYEINEPTWIHALSLVECTNINLRYIILVADSGKHYYFELPYQNNTDYYNWCAQSNLSDFYHSIKTDPNWRHDDYETRCLFKRGNGINCARYSEQDYCWQHR